jgi:hypothetical protein
VKTSHKFGIASLSFFLLTASIFSVIAWTYHWCAGAGVIGLACGILAITALAAAQAFEAAEIRALQSNEEEEEEE